MSLNFSSRGADAHRAAELQLCDPACERERLQLLALGERVVAHVPGARFAFQNWMQAVDDLNDDACTTFSPEAALASLAAELRRLWLNTAHGSADRHMKSPQGPVMTPAGNEIRFGYERDLQPLELERRCATYAPTPTAWSSDHVLFSSAQGGLASILHWAQEEGFWSATQTPHVAFAGNYFETQDLLDLFCHSGLTWAKPGNFDLAKEERAHASRVILIEPVFYDDGVNVVDIDAFHRVWRELQTATSDSAPHLIVLDTTLTGPLFPLGEFLAPLVGPTAPIVVNVHSGMKLDQAGLELAGTGIVSIYRPERDAAHAVQIAERLRRIRSSTGVGLTLDEISALEAPWFLDRAYANEYAEAVFENNSQLADALTDKLQLFAQVLHPKFARATCSWAKAPYSVLRLREPAPENYEALERVICDECEQRELLFDRGGSFGFRGHRFETVIPARGRGEPFLRIAMGARDGPSCRGIIALMRELAAVENIEKLHARYAGAFARQS